MKILRNMIYGKTYLIQEIGELIFFSILCMLRHVFFLIINICIKLIYIFISNQKIIVNIVRLSRFMLT